MVISAPASVKGFSYAAVPFKPANHCMFEKTVSFLKLYLDVEIVDRVCHSNSIWKHTAIEKGKLICTPECDLGDLLHEAGHIATAPNEIRHLISGDVALCIEEFLSYKENFDIDYRWQNWTESAAIGWAYLLSEEISIPFDIVFATTFSKNLPSYKFQFKHLQQHCTYLQDLLRSGLIGNVYQSKLSIYTQI